MEAPCGLLGDALEDIHRKLAVVIRVAVLFSRPRGARDEGMGGR